MVESLEKEWYAVQTYSGYEGKVKHDIESRTQSISGMENYIFRVIIPSEKKNGRKKREINRKRRVHFQRLRPN
jgi:transcriptional antiterminator NusG